MPPLFGCRLQQGDTFFSISLAVSKKKVIFAARKQKTTTNMETRKFKQVPSINRIGGQNPTIPAPIIVSCGKNKKNERIITRPMRTDSRAIGTGKPINWNEVYS